MAARRHNEMDLDPAVVDVTADEGWAQLDRQARDCLGISGAEFVHRWLNGRIRMTMLEGPDYVPWHLRPIRVRESDQDDIDEEIPPNVELSDEEFDEMFDQMARTELGISGKAFIRKFKAGEYPDWDPELASLVMLIPFVSEQPD